METLKEDYQADYSPEKLITDYSADFKQKINKIKKKKKKSKKIKKKDDENQLQQNIDQDINDELESVDENDYPDDSKKENHFLENIQISPEKMQQSNIYTENTQICKNGIVYLGHSSKNHAESAVQYQFSIIFSQLWEMGIFSQFRKKRHVLNQEYQTLKQNFLKISLLAALLVITPQQIGSRYYAYNMEVNFNIIFQNSKVRGSSKIFLKFHGKDKTEFNEENTIKELQNGLRDDNKAYIYHCQNHYMCPIGYEIVPNQACDAYQNIEKITSDKLTNWVLIGDPSKTSPGIHCKKWSDILTDLKCQNPYHFNIRKTHQGIQKKTGEQFQEGGKKFGRNIHTIIEFQKISGNFEKIIISKTLDQEFIKNSSDSDSEDSSIQ